jgi:hypothetical protein
MRPPIIVIDEAGVDMFASVGDAEGYVESPDVDTLTVYDGQGLPLVFDVMRTDDEVDGRWVVSVYPVRLRPAEGAAARPEELRRLLIRALKDAGPDLRDAPLAEVVRRAWQDSGGRRTRWGNWRFGGNPFPGDDRSGGPG